MGNWFENNPAKSVVIHTFVVIGATWAFFTFVYDENRLNLSRAQVEESKSVAEQYKAKADVLQTENLRLAAQNDTYVRWLQGQNGSFPNLEAQIKRLESEKTKLTEALTKAEGGQTPSTSSPTPTGPYAYESRELKQGQAFVDPLTGASIGVSDINADYQARASVTLPGRDTQIVSASPGQTWKFDYHDKKFILTLTKVIWLTNSFQVSVREMQ